MVRRKRNSDLVLKNVSYTALGMGFRIYRHSIEGVSTGNQPGDRSGDWLHEAYWDGSMDAHLDFCFYELMSLKQDEICEELPEWYEMLLPFASHPVSTDLTRQTYDPKKDNDADLMLAFMKRTIDANDTWVIY